LTTTTSARAGHGNARTTARAAPTAADHSATTGRHVAAGVVAETHRETGTVGVVATNQPSRLTTQFTARNVARGVGELVDRRRPRPSCGAW
jgi:hypothetical protein